MDRSWEMKSVIVSPDTTLSSSQTRALPVSVTRCSRSKYSARCAVPVRQSLVMIRTPPVETVRRTRSPFSSSHDVAAEDDEVLLTEALHPVGVHCERLRLVVLRLRPARRPGDRELAG